MLRSHRLGLFPCNHPAGAGSGGRCWDAGEGFFSAGVGGRAVRCVARRPLVAVTGTTQLPLLHLVGHPVKSTPFQYYVSPTQDTSRNNANLSHRKGQTGATLAYLEIIVRIMVKITICGQFSSHRIHEVYIFKSMLFQTVPAC